MLNTLFRGYYGAITHVTTKSPKLALTFDDGPNPKYTPNLLDILEKYKANATFFIVGKSAQNHPGIIDDILAGGNEIACHSWSHASFPTLTRKKRIEEIRKCEASLNGKLKKYFRPPYGHLNFFSHLDVALLGYKLVTWSISSNDWLDYDANWMTDKIIRKTKPGSIVLMHDALFTYTDQRYRNRTGTIEAVDRILNALNQQYQFVTLTELINAGKPHYKKWVSLPDKTWLNGLKIDKDRHEKKKTQAMLNAKRDRE